MAYFSEEFARVSTKVFSLAREMEKFEVDAIPQLKMKDEEKFRHAMEVLPKAGANYVLVISKPENLVKILEKVIPIFLPLTEPRILTLIVCLTLQ